MSIYLENCIFCRFYWVDQSTIFVSIKAIFLIYNTEIYFILTKNISFIYPQMILLFMTQLSSKIYIQYS
jgi:hypothetical protein